MAAPIRIAGLGLTLLSSVAAAAGVPKGVVADAPFVCNQSPLLVTNVRLWTGAPSPPTREVLIVDGRVAAAGRVGRLRVPKNARKLDGRGALMLPGFVDAHTHYVLPAPAPKLGGDQREQELAITGRAALSSGVTAGRIHLMPLDQVRKLRARADDPCFPSPRLIFGGPGFFGTWGQREASIGSGVTSPAQVARKLREFRSAGMDWVALHDADKIAPEDLDAIAKGRGLSASV